MESPPSPSPSDLICEFFHSGYSEEEVATTVDRVVPPEDLARAGLQAGDKVEIIRRIVHRKTSASALRPWKGPIPKVSLPKLTVFDLIRPEEWVTVKRKKKMRSSPRGSRSPAPAVAAAAAAIQTSRAAALARLLRAAGPERSVATDVGVGPDQHGYAAHVSSEAHTGFSIEPCTFNHRDSIAPAPSVEGARVRRSGRRGYPGCGARRARRIPPLHALAGGMRLRPRQAAWQVGEELLRRFRGLVVEPLRSGFGRLRRSGALLGVVVRPRRSTTAVLRLLLYGSREATKSPRPREPGSRRRCRRRRVGAD